MKTERELREKLEQVLAIDGRIQPEGMSPGAMMFTKATAGKLLLWALGENDDNHFYITAEPGPPVNVSNLR